MNNNNTIYKKKDYNKIVEQSQVISLSCKRFRYKQFIYYLHIIICLVMTIILYVFSYLD